MRSPKMTAALTVLLMVDSLHFVFGRIFAPLLSPFVSAFYVLAIAALEIAVFLAIRRKIDLRVLRDNYRFFLVVGALVAAATIFSYTSVTYIDAGTASLLSRLSTVITLALSYFWLRERLSRNEWIGAAISISGAFIISFQPGALFRVGTLFVVASITAYSLHIAVVKRYADNIEFGNFFLYRVGTTALFLALFLMISGKAVSPPSINVWLLLTLAATVDVVISRILYYWVLRQMTLGTHTILLTLSPFVTVIWSFILFQEIPTVQALAGGAVVIAGVLLVTRTKK
jgi:drug/metabolite transporter (DMT)-like permease